MAITIGLNMSCMVSVQQPTQLCIGRARTATSNYKPRTVSFTRCSIPFNRRLSFNHAVKPISALLKGNHGYCFCSSSVLDFPKDNKVKCCWNKTADLGKLEQSVTFDDIKGVDAPKTELLKIVLNIKEDSEYIKLGLKLCKGVLLTGPSRTGKTLLARAVAGKAGVSFFTVSSSELVDQDSPTGATRVRDLFREARKNSPSIIFIDEIDVVGSKRGGTLNCERDQTLNQLLTEMDWFEKEENVVVIGASNRPETLDPALVRPGRLFRKVWVNVPDESGRKDILAHYLKDVPMEENKEDISAFVASITPGLEWVDLENIVGDSVVLATRRGGELVTQDDIFEAVNSVTGKLFSYFLTTQNRVEDGSASTEFGFPN